MISSWSSKQRDNTSFITNGSKLLKESISFSSAKCNPIRSFSAEELKKATQNYSSRLIIAEDSTFELYRGFLHDRLVTVKKYNSFIFRFEGDPFKDALFSSVFSVQENVMKLLGCCLETEFPILIIEYAENGTLQDCLFEYVDQPLPWKSRLKIAVELCNAVAYLHNAFPKPIIHRNINPRSIFLNENNAPKLSDFSLSIAIPDGEFWVEYKFHEKYEEETYRLTGTFAPETATGCYDEKIDVYAVGTVLPQLLTQKGTWIRDISNNYAHCQACHVAEKLHEINEVVDVQILEEGQWPGKEKQLEYFARIALQWLCAIMRKIDEQSLKLQNIRVEFTNL